MTPAHPATSGKHPMAARRSTTGEALDYRAQLWSMADALRGSMDAAEYKHVVLGLIFLKYISDAFEERHAQVLAQWGEEAAEDRDEYIAENIFWVPPAARWSVLQAQAHQPTIGTVVDDAMTAIESDNPALRDVLPKDYARPALDKTRLGQVIDMVSNIKVGGAEARATDVLGSVYEYFLEQFALAEGARAASSTPRAASSASWSKCSSPTRPRLRPLLRLLRHVRPVHPVHPGPRHRQRQRPPRTSILWRPNSSRCLHLRPGVQLHHLAHGPHEPRHPRHRRPDRPRRQLPQRPPPRPARRLHPGQSALQRLRLGRRAGCRTTSAGGTATRPGATPTSPGSSTSCTTWRPAAAPASSSPTAPCRPASPAKARSARTSSRPAWSTASSPSPASSSAPPRSPPASGSCRATRALRRSSTETLFVDASYLGHMLDRTRATSCRRHHHDRLTYDDLSLSKRVRRLHETPSPGRKRARTTATTPSSSTPAISAT